MNEPNSNPTRPGAEPLPGALGKAAPVSQSRRRLIRAGATAVPVIATLVSRPAHAWSCRSPSAWGSIQANPNTSLQNNAGHQVYTDETWTLTNWKNNTARSATGYDNKPWNKLKNRFPRIGELAKDKDESFNYEKVTVTMLQSEMGIQIPVGVSGASKVHELMGMSGFGGYCLAAQMNYILLSALAANQIERCLSLDDLKQMARGTYPASASRPWSQSEVRTYLRENYIATT